MASWIRYLQVDFDERGKPIEVVDANAKELKRLARSAAAQASSFLSNASIFGEDMSRFPMFANLVDDALMSLRTIGTNATLNKLHDFSWQGR